MSSIPAATPFVIKVQWGLSDFAVGIVRFSKVQKMPIFGVLMRVRDPHQKKIRYCRYRKYRSARVPLRLLLSLTVAAYPLLL